MLGIKYGKAFTFTFYHRGIDVQNLISIHLAVWHIRDVIWVWDVIHCSRHHKTTVIICSSDPWLCMWYDMCVHVYVMCVCRVGYEMSPWHISNIFPARIRNLDS